LFLVSILYLIFQTKTFNLEAESEEYGTIFSKAWQAMGIVMLGTVGGSSLQLKSPNHLLLTMVSVSIAMYNGLALFVDLEIFRRTVPSNDSFGETK
jgi:hypothetical protein